MHNMQPVPFTAWSMTAHEDTAHVLAGIPEVKSLAVPCSALHTQSGRAASRSTWDVHGGHELLRTELHSSILFLQALLSRGKILVAGQRDRASAGAHGALLTARPLLPTIVGCGRKGRLAGRRTHSLDCWIRHDACSTPRGHCQPGASARSGVDVCLAGVSGPLLPLPDVSRRPRL